MWHFKISRFFALFRICANLFANSDICISEISHSVSRFSAVQRLRDPTPQARARAPRPKASFMGWVGSRPSGRGRGDGGAGAQGGRPQPKPKILQHTHGTEWPGKSVSLLPSQPKKKIIALNWGTFPNRNNMSRIWYQSPGKDRRLNSKSLPPSRREKYTPLPFGIHFLPNDLRFSDHLKCRCRL